MRVRPNIPLTSVTVYSIPPGRKTYAYSANKVVLMISHFH